MSLPRKKAQTGSVAVRQKPRRKPRTYKTPRCSVQRCAKRAEIAGRCVGHAEKYADKLYRKLCREMDGTCRMAGTFGIECWGPLQGAHIYRVRHRQLRWSMKPRNCFGLCSAHHTKVDNDQAAWLDYIEAVWTPEEAATAHGLAYAPADRRESIREALAWLDRDQDGAA